MNRKLAYTVYRPEGNVKAAVFIVHGMQEHQRRYKDFAEAQEAGSAMKTAGATWRPA